MSEKDIKVLEKLQEIFEELRKDDEEGHGSAYELQWEDIHAIENLIKKNKEYENYYKCEKNLLDNYISKDKIKKEIKKLNENNGVKFDLYTGQTLKTKEDYQIAILKKLLKRK